MLLNCCKYLSLGQSIGYENKSRAYLQSRKSPYGIARAVKQNRHHRETPSKCTVLTLHLLPSSGGDYLRALSSYPPQWWNDISQTRTFEELHPPLAHSFQHPPTPIPLHQLRPRITRTSLTTVFYDSACNSNTPSRLAQQTSTHSSPQSRKSTSCRIGLDPLLSSLKRGRFGLSADTSRAVLSATATQVWSSAPLVTSSSFFSRCRCKLRRRIFGTTGEVRQIHCNPGFREGWGGRMVYRGRSALNPRSSTITLIPPH